jgi:hypothetical protein
VLLPNGGNWFRFQNPLVVTDADVDQRRVWVLDLVFNPEGIVKGFAGDGVSGNLRERDTSGTTMRAMTVPMLDLVPVPHRSTDAVVRESYVGTVDLGTNSFDARIELYSVEGDPTIYGIDAKSLVNGGTRQMPPNMEKISYLAQDGDHFSFMSWSKTPIIEGFARAAAEGATTHASIVCATHSELAGGPGGTSAIVVEACPSSSLDVAFTLVARTRLTDGIPVAVGNPDAGPEPDAAR